MESLKTLGMLGGLLLLSATVQAQTPAPVLLSTAHTECDKLFLEIETPVRLVIVGKSRTVRIPLTTPTLKYTGGILQAPEGANLLVVSRPGIYRRAGEAPDPAENGVTWKFYKADNPKEFVEQYRGGVFFKDKDGKILPAPRIHIKRQPPTVGPFRGSKQD